MVIPSGPSASGGMMDTTAAGHQEDAESRWEKEAQGKLDTPGRGDIEHGLLVGDWFREEEERGRTHCPLQSLRLKRGWRWQRS